MAAGFSRSEHSKGPKWGLHGFFRPSCRTHEALLLLHSTGYKANPDLVWEGSIQGPGNKKVWLVGKPSLETS